MPLDALEGELCALHRLIDELTVLQRRLGTPLETDDDLQHVRELGHDICGKLQLFQAWSELAAIERHIDATCGKLTSSERR